MKPDTDPTGNAESRVGDVTTAGTEPGAPTPYYADDLVTLYHADCLDVLPLLPPADLIFTSPPFNLGAQPWANLGHWKPGNRSSGGSSKWRAGVNGAGGASYVEHDDKMPWPEYVAWQHAVLRACWDRLNDAGAIYYNHKPRVVGSQLWTPLELNPGLDLRQIVIWARAGGMNFNPAAYVSTHEWLMVLAKPAFRLASKGASGLGDVWRVLQEMNNPHPAPFPVGLPARAIESARPTLVLDPFAGSGTTLVAAKAAGVRAIGIEISERYCDMAVARLAQGALDFGAAS